MAQAGNANRRDDPYDRKIRPAQTYPVRADGSSVNGNFGVFACTESLPEDTKNSSNYQCVCYLTAVSFPPVVEPFHTAKR